MILMKIKDLVSAVLKTYWDQKLPVDPIAIAQKMGADVRPSDAMGDISGWFSLSENGPEIHYNIKEPSVRQRFTVAHELGHYVLSHGDNFRDPVSSFSSSNYDPIEASANKFAAELLMPATLVSRAIEDHGISDIGRLAKLFNVSEAAMKFRLKNLNWIS